MDITTMRQTVTWQTCPTVTVGSSAPVLLTAALRQAVLLQAGLFAIYLGDATVTAATGLKVEAGALVMDALTNGPLYGITSAGESIVRVQVVV